MTINTCRINSFHSQCKHRQLCFILTKKLIYPKTISKKPKSEFLSEYYAEHRVVTYLLFIEVRI